jgi:hypothetical protein
MSKIPTVFEPKGAFSFLLSCIKEYNPLSRKSGILPHLLTFIADPIIQELLNSNKDPTTPAPSGPQTQITGIQSTLSSLSKAISSIQKQLNTNSKTKATAPTKGKDGKTKPPQKTYLAIAGARPPNPSLVVDLAHLGLVDEDRPRPEVICSTLNVKLSALTPPQAMLAAIRWIA